jgi:hypothetical protein
MAEVAPSGNLRIRLLGGFRVVVGDRAVPDSAWRLRKPKVETITIIRASRAQFRKTTSTWPGWRSRIIRDRPSRRVQKTRLPSLPG